ncbi:MAG: molybdopterin synthase sulfur carrier subunit [Marinoscillum sp.]|jgi:molybdopterin synthase sulfur carrier subunit
MSVTIKYFGALAEQIGLDEEQLNIEDFGGSVKQLKELSVTRFNFIRNSTFQIALNQTLVQDGQVRDGDEIAFLPPFAGG